MSSNLQNGLLLFFYINAIYLLFAFIIQPENWKTNKNELKLKSKFIYIQSLLFTFSVFILLNSFLPISIIGIIALLFLIIEIIISYKKSLYLFTICHVSFLLIVFGLLLHHFNLYDQIPIYQQKLQSNLKIWIIIISYLICVGPVTYIINLATAKMRDKLSTDSNQDLGLEKAGKYIGIFERIITLTLVLYNQYDAIGFIITAKSILRFNELRISKSQNTRGETEYVLIGTLLSFSLAILVGVLANTILSKIQKF